MARYPAALPEPESKLIDSPLFPYQSRYPVCVRVAPLRQKRSYNEASRQAIGMGTKKNAPAAFTTGASVSVVAGTRNQRYRHSLMVAILSPFVYPKPYPS